MSIDLELTPAQRELKETSRELAADFAERALQHDAERSLPVENFAALREAGMYDLVIPKELGGRGGGALDWLVVAEEIAQGDASTALCFNMHINATGGICQRPAIDSATKQRVAQLAIEDGSLFCTSVSEPTSSSLLPSTYVPTVLAREVDGGLSLTGRKMFASAFEASDYCYTYAHIDGDPSPASAVGVVIPSNAPGIEVTDVWDTLGMRGTRSNQVDFTDVFVPADLELYRTENFVEAFIIQEANYAFGGYTCAYLGLGLGIVQWVGKFLGERTGKGFAQPMGYHPDMSRRVGEMVNAIEAARLSHLSGRLALGHPAAQPADVPELGPGEVRGRPGSAGHRLARHGRLRRPRSLPPAGAGADAARRAHRAGHAPQRGRLRGDDRTALDGPRSGGGADPESGRAGPGGLSDGDRLTPRAPRRSHGDRDRRG